MPATRTPGLPAALREQFDALLADLIPPGSKVALVDWPAYGNVGDHLIYLGTVEALRRLGADVVYTADVLGYREAGLRAALGKGIILLSGGGNFGDRYPLIQRTREHILLDFPETPVIGLPQTLDFTDAAARSRVAAILEAHADVDLIWRDETSLQIAQESFPAKIRHRLAPDCAFGLEDLPPPTHRRLSSQVWLTRSDDERQGERLLPPPGLLTTVADWMDIPPSFQRSPRGRLRQAAIRGARLGSRTPAAAERWGRGLTRIRTMISRSRLRAGVELVESGDVLVTDRLHGHILGLLLDKPQVLVDTGYGKIDRFVSTWTADASRFSRASDAEEASTAAEKLSRDIASD